MAQYFRPLTERKSQGGEVSSSRLQRGSNVEGDVATSSILIFPKAPSERRSSYGSAVESQYELTGSTPSLPTDMSPGSLSGDRQTAGSEFSWQSVALSRGQGQTRGWDELLLEEASVASDWEAESGIFKKMATRWTPRTLTGNHHTRSRASSGLSSHFLPFSPEPPFRLPFLSFLQSFLTLDESTLHLISRSPDSYTPALFPSSPGTPPLLPTEKEEETIHGSLKLLLYNPDKPQDMALLQASLDTSQVPEEGNALLLSPSHMSVLKLMKLVIDGGTRAWKEVRVWSVGEASLIGV